MQLYRELCVYAVCSVLYVCVHTAAVGRAPSDIGKDEVGEATGSTLFSCGFETEDLCGITQSTADDEDWLRWTGPTRSSRTGPDQANSGEYYMHIDASSVRDPEYARLDLPLLQYSGSACLTLSYHMYGADIGALDVGLSGGDSVFRVDGDMGNQWLQESITVTLAPDSQVYITATGGGSSRGDVSIDDVIITEGGCPIFSCDFESDLCGMQQSINDNGDWERTDSPTTTSRTGPPAAYSNRYYVYIDGSNYGSERSASLELPLVSFAGAACLTLPYHMYGADTGKLEVASTLEGVIINIEGDQGDQWHVTHVTLMIAPDTQLTVTASGTSGPRGDIAIDALAIRAGRCEVSDSTTTPAPPPTSTEESVNVDFNMVSCSDLSSTEDNSRGCVVEQVVTDDLTWYQRSGATPSGAKYMIRRPETGRRLVPRTGPVQALTGTQYIYVEASSTTRGQLASIAINNEDLSTQSSTCLGFTYSMNGGHVGTLRVRDGEDIRWEMTGHQSVEWQDAQIDLPYTRNTQVTMEVITGNGVNGDIAVDQLQWQAGRCVGERGDALFACNFEYDVTTATMCDVTQSGSRDFRWMLGKGNTPSKRTGPAAAYNGVYYAYIEASEPRTSGDTADMSLPLEDVADVMCATFAYNMNGKNMGSLQLVVVDDIDNSGDDHVVVWQESGDRGEGWLTAAVTVEGITEGQQLVLRAVVGSGYAGDTAVDAIHISQVDCAAL